MKASKDMIPIEQRGAIPTVNARRVHEVLGVGRDFSNWIKGRIGECGFTEGRDYVTVARSPNPASGNRGAAIEYHLTLDMAKHLCLMERTPKGHEIREYFIAVESTWVHYQRNLVHDTTKERRRNLASQWSAHGIKRPEHFAGLTVHEYKCLGFHPKKRKKDMGVPELLKLSAADGLEAYRLSRSPQVQGLEACKDSLNYTASVIQLAEREADGHSLIPYELEVVSGKET
ncbi:MAG TPA: antA/AntB antirepressor family protein [Anaerolineae bacterium]|nr:antA/AntB antirepressor family protein [Anaerolineae bacterium]